MRKYAEINFPESEVICVYYDIGHPYAWKEKAVLPKDVLIHDMKWFNAVGVGKEGNNTGNCFIPGRNLVFATLAASQYLPDEIWLGALQGEIHAKATDKNYVFAYSASKTLSYTLSPFKESVSIVFPLADAEFGKLDATRWALQYGMKEAILNSSSCMEGEVGNCGRCATCLRRWGIFKQLGLDETYNVHPIESKVHSKMIIEMIDEILTPSFNPHYDLHRITEIVPALQMHYNETDLNLIKEKVKQ